ncbi:MAG TPA: nitronate monooxygenase [Acidimicrobiia bacterium]|nr:nitronate monooxygenase [Acidimicrobiia bacterium]
MLPTRFTELVGCELPVQQAGMGGVAGPDLAVAVSAAGGLGTVALHTVPASTVAATLEAMAQRTSAPLAFNVLMPFADRDAVEAASSRCRLVEFFYGDPDADLVGLVQQGGALAAWQIGSLAEAEAARDTGCDLLIAQGVEAGGHVRGRIGLFGLLSAVLDAVEVPVIAAGGIGSARTAAAAFAAGADAVRVGTRFVATQEADAHPDYAAALVDARAEDTILTDTFSVMWADAPHRVLRSCVDRVNALEDETIGEIEIAGMSMPVPRRSVLVPTRATTGSVDAMALYAGESVNDVAALVPAGDVVVEIATGAEELLCRRGGQAV